MNGEFVQGNWKSLQGKMQERWIQQLNEDLIALDKHREKLAKVIMERSCNLQEKNEEFFYS